MTQEPRVLWMTNLAPPYRLPVWSEMAKSLDLRIALLESHARLSRDRDANRGRDWVPPKMDYPIHQVRSARLARREARHYVAVDPHLWAEVKAVDVVVLGGWESPAYWQLLFLAWLFKKGTVGFYESTLATQSFPGGLIARARSFFFNALDVVVVPGPAAEEALRHMGVPASSVVTGFNAVDSDAFAAVRQAPDAANGHRFLYVGQLIPRKRVDAIIGAFAEITRPQDSLTIVGRGELRGQLARRARELGVADQVNWIDFVANSILPNYMAQADTLVLASDEEVWGLVVNEALAAGLQTVITRNCGVVPSVEHMEGVFIADNSFDLASAMNKSMTSYSGRIHQPEILRHTPAAFASTFARAVVRSLSTEPSVRPCKSGPSHKLSRLWRQDE